MFHYVCNYETIWTLLSVMGLFDPVKEDSDSGQRTIDWTYTVMFEKTALQKVSYLWREIHFPFMDRLVWFMI